MLRVGKEAEKMIKAGVPGRILVVHNEKTQCGPKRPSGKSEEMSSIFSKLIT